MMGKMARGGTGAGYRSPVEDWMEKGVCVQD
jgi:hypothetical protein